MTDDKAAKTDEASVFVSVLLGRVSYKEKGGSFLLILLYAPLGQLEGGPLVHLFSCTCWSLRFSLCLSQLVVAVIAGD